MMNWRVVVRFILVFPLLGCGGPDLSFDAPREILATPDQSKLFILDSKNHRVLVATGDLRYLGEITHPYISANEGNIYGMCLTHDGLLAFPNFRRKNPEVTQQDLKANSIGEVLFFDQTGRLVHEWRWVGNQGPIISPQWITELPDNTFLISDVFQDKIFHLDFQARILGSFGEFGPTPGQIYCPQGMTRLDSGEILLIDSYNSRLQLFTPEGKFSRIFAEKGSEPGQVLFPEYVFRGPRGEIYCSELETRRVSVFDANGEFKRALIPRLSEDNPGEFFELKGIIFLQQMDRLLVLDSYNSRIHFFTPEGRWEKSISQLNSSTAQVGK